MLVFTTPIVNHPTIHNLSVDHEKDYISGASSGA
jgi:hypothetical protein